jgi:formate dehydrogenase accessory protein FdhD
VAKEIIPGCGQGLELVWSRGQRQKMTQREQQAMRASPDAGDAGIPETVSSRPVTVFCAGTFTRATDDIIEEIPVALVYNGISHAVMLASPADLEDLAIGFSLSEGIARTRREIYGIEIKPAGSGIVIDIEIPAGRFMALKERRRALAGRTGCGLCGVESLEAFDRAPAFARNAQGAANAGADAAPDILSPTPVPASLCVTAIAAALEDFSRWQTVRERTGAAHGAAWARLDGGILLVREDVGRHNALDKLIGVMAARQVDAAAGFALISSRASYEMAQKALRAGMTALVAVSAPTGMAARLAEEAGLLLVGFARASRLVAYTFPQRLLP